jgi:hypothetical protein
MDDCCADILLGSVVLAGGKVEVMELVVSVFESVSTPRELNPTGGTSLCTWLSFMMS